MSRRAVAVIRPAPTIFARQHAVPYHPVGLRQWHACEDLSTSLVRNPTSLVLARQACALQRLEPLHPYVNIEPVPDPRSEPSARAYGIKRHSVVPCTRDAERRRQLGLSITYR